MTREHCERTQEALARFLDGDLAAGASDLEAHVSDCAICDRDLRRARRLDALWAATSDVSVSDDSADARIANALAAAAAAEDVPSPARATPRGWLRTSVLAASAVIGIVIWELVWGVFGRGAAEPTRVVGREIAVERSDVVPAESASSVDMSDRDLGPGWIRLPDVVGGREAGSVAGRVRQAPSALPVFAVVGWRDRLERAIAWRDFMSGIPSSRASRAAAADAIVRAACRADLEGASDASFDRRATVLRELVVRSELEPALAVLARECGWVQQLLRTSRVRAEPWWIAACARFGDDRTERVVLDVVASDLDSSTRFVTALRGSAERPGRGRLLLELWRHLAIRGRVESRDDVLAADWFGGLGDREVDDVLVVLRRSRSLDEQLRCVHALAALRHEASRMDLAALLDARRRPLAELAAFALGRLPLSDELERTRPEPRRRPALRWAALASQGHPAAKRRVAALQLTDEERAFLLAGSFSPSQIPIAAALFDERRSRSLDD